MKKDYERALNDLVSCICDCIGGDERIDFYVSCMSEESAANFNACTHGSSHDTIDQICADFKEKGWDCKLVNKEDYIWDVTRSVKFSNGEYTIIGQINVGASGCCWIHKVGVLDDDMLTIVQRLIKICKERGSK